jgi:integrase
MIHALEWSGARPSELAGATIQDYNKAESLIVLEKHKTDRTGRPRMLYVSDKLAALIAESLSGRPPELLTPESHLFRVQTRFYVALVRDRRMSMRLY